MILIAHNIDMDTYVNELINKLEALKNEQEELNVETKSIQDRLSTVNRAIESIQQLLKIEGIDSPIFHGEKPLAEFIKDALNDGKAHSVEKIINSVKSMGYEFGDKNPVRSVNFTLLGLKRGGNYERVGKDWRYVGR